MEPSRRYGRNMKLILVIVYILTVKGVHFRCASHITRLSRMRIIYDVVKVYCLRNEWARKDSTSLRFFSRCVR